MRRVIFVAMPPVACYGTQLEAIILTAKTTWRTMIAREIDRHERCIPLAVRVPEQKLRYESNFPLDISQMRIINA